MADEPKQNKAKKLPQYLAAVCICIGAMATGTIIGWSANITPQLKAGHLNGFKMNDEQLGWAGSSMTLGAMVMCFPVALMADYFGRKPTVLSTVIPFTIGWVLIIFAQHIIMVYVGRFLTGIAGGSFCVTAPLYTSEIAEIEIRGRLGTFFQLFITIGILYAQVFGYAVPMMAHNIVLGVVPLVFAVLFFFQPETPFYLLKKGKKDKAMLAYQKLRGKDYDYSAEMKATEERLESEAQRKGCLETMKTKSAKKATMICFMLMFYQQMSGINAVMFYTNAIFTSAGSSLAAHWCVIIIGIVQVAATVFASWAVEKLGRKVLLMASCGFMGLACFLLGLFFSLKDHKVLDADGLKTIGFLPILAVIIFIIAFSIGLGPLPWVATAEISPPEIMAKCGSAAATFNWALAFLVTRFYLSVANAIGTDITFYIFATCCITGIFFVLFVIPETRGKTLAEIKVAMGG